MLQHLPPFHSRHSIPPTAVQRYLCGSSLLSARCTGSDVSRLTGYRLTAPEFTFALEQDRSYTIGRDKDADIPIDSRRLKTKEGTLQVGHWKPDEVSSACCVELTAAPDTADNPLPL